MPVTTFKRGGKLLGYRVFVSFSRPNNGKKREYVYLGNFRTRQEAVLFDITINNAFDKIKQDAFEAKLQYINHLRNAKGLSEYEC